MPRPATGQVVEKPNRRGTTFGLRFRAYGERRYVTLPDGTSRAEAELELQNVLADVRRGIWKPTLVEPVEVPVDPTFHEFASEWFKAISAGVRPATVSAYRHELVGHLLPFFARHRLSQITVAEVDRYRDQVLRENARRRAALDAGDPLTETITTRGKSRQRVLRPMSGSYLNKTITRLGQILDVADERGLIDRNPVRVNPGRRKVKVSRARRAYLDRPEQIAALLDAAGRIDAEARHDRDGCLRRPLLATLLFAGLRIGEALALRWRDVDLAGGRIRVADSKTDAGVRWVPILPALRDELLSRKTSTRYPGPENLVFCSRTGSKLSKDNTRTRVLGRAHELADEALLADDLAPLPETLTQHGLRHTYISLRVALGDDPATIAQDAGHADMSVTFRIYTHVMRLAPGDREALRQLVGQSVVEPGVDLLSSFGVRPTEQSL
jgi:integrase